MQGFRHPATTSRHQAEKISICFGFGWTPWQSDRCLRT